MPPRKGSGQLPIPILFCNLFETSFYYSKATGFDPNNASKPTTFQSGDTKCHPEEVVWFTRLDKGKDPILSQVNDQIDFDRGTISKYRKYYPLSIDIGNREAGCPQNLS